MSNSSIKNLDYDSTRKYFQNLIQEGMENRGIETEFVVKTYLASLLERYIDVRNLFIEEETGKMSSQTLAEMFLKANNTSDKSLRKDMLKRAAETSLYISGFFAESLNKKIIDIDYYIHMGGCAYSALADIIGNSSDVSNVYVECAERFLSFVEVLSYIKERSFINNDENILSIYEHYLRTGSELAHKKLLKKGVLVPSTYKPKK